MNTLRIIVRLGLCLGALTLGGCGMMTHPPSPAETDATIDEYDDPHEGWNRGVYQFNRTVDGVLLRPVTMVYRGVVPKQGQKMASNFIANLYMPVSFANSLLQGDVDNAFASFWRFTLNSTIGIGGLFDVAKETDLKYQYRKTNFGETLALWGAEPGHYVVIPIVGPSNTRDYFGRLGDIVMNPFNLISIPTTAIFWSATAVDKRSEYMQVIDGTYSSSLDPYATFRSLYGQKREGEIRKLKAARYKALEKAKSK